MSYFRQTLIAACLTLLCSAVSAQKNPSTETPQKNRLMNNDQQISAFFYKKPVVLDREQHKGLRLKGGDARFASKNQAVPLLVTEFAEACLEYPIVFSKGNDGQWMALALTGLTADTNAFVDAKGAWSGRYAPISVRRYPFILAEGANQQFSLAADLSAPQLGNEGEALFDDKGEPTELVRNILNLLGEFQAQAKVTEAVIGKLDEAQLLVQQSLQVRLGDGRSAVADGVWVVDEKKLRELPDDKILAWFKGGELTAIHAQMLSLRNLVPLLERSQPVQLEKPTEPPKTGNKTKAS
jgi:hypothetical protein